MKATDAEDKTQAIIAGEYEDSDILRKFSIKEKEGAEYEDTQRKATETWKRKLKAWSKVKELEVKATDSKQARTKYEKELESYKKIYKYYTPGRPPFPGADVPILSMLDVLGGGEYLDKPYDMEALVELIEMNQRLKSSVMVYARNSVGLGINFRPTLGREVADFTPDELKLYKEQGRALISRYNSWVEQGKPFTQAAYEVGYGKAGLGEGYFEIIDSADGKIQSVRVISPIYIWETPERDRYLWIKNGKKKYFKKFNDKEIRDIENFDKKGREVPVDRRATRLLPFREYNLVSDVYGVPMWTGAIPQVIGSRYAAERNTNFFLNDACPRMCILVAGGAVDDATLESLKSFFAKGKGRSNAGRVLLLCVSSKNALSPSAKPPTVTMEPLTVGKTDDGSFMNYSAGCDETIREAFRIALTFYGTAGDSNRASSYTLRDQTVSMVNKPEAELMAALCNDTFTHEYAIEKGWRKVEKDNLLAEIYFVTPTTMSEKDQKELHIMELTAGALTINDYRSQINLEKIDKWWAEMPKTLAVSAVQLSEISPALIATMSDDPKFVAAMTRDRGDDVASGEISTDTIVDETTKALLYIRTGLQEVLKENCVKPNTLKMLDKVFDLVKNAQNEDDAAVRLCNHDHK